MIMFVCNTTDSCGTNYRSNKYSIIIIRTAGVCGIADEVASEPGEDYPELVGGNCEYTHAVRHGS